MKICKHCNTKKPLADFGRNGKTPKGRLKYKPECRSCTNKIDYPKRNARFKLLLKRVFGKLECQRCGYDKCLAALDCHHRDPTEKEYSPSTLKNYTESIIINELNKCDLLCANCHREHHAGM